MDFLILLRNILVPVAILMWVIIGLVALIIFLRNKFSGKRIKSIGNVYKETFVQNHSTSLDNSVNTDNTEDIANGANGADGARSPNGTNKGGSSLCL